MPLDQRGRDNPPIFYIDPDLDNGKYFALLTEPIARSWAHPFPVHLQGALPRTVDGDLTSVRPRGIYTFDKIEARDKFCRICNGASGIEEYEVAYPVTVPGLHPQPVKRQSRRDTTSVKDVS